MQTADSAASTPAKRSLIGSQLRQNHEEIFYRFDRRGTLPRTIARQFETHERTVCEIVRTEYRQIIERVKRAS